LLPEDAVSFQNRALEGIEHAAVAFAVDVANGQYVAAKLTGALVSRGAAPGDAGTKHHGRARGGVAVILRPRRTGEDGRHGKPGACDGCGLQEPASVDSAKVHQFPPTLGCFPDCPGFW